MDTFVPAVNTGILCSQACDTCRGNSFQASLREDHLTELEYFLTGYNGRCIFNFLHCFYYSFHPLTFFIMGGRFSALDQHFCGMSQAPNIRISRSFKESVPGTRLRTRTLNNNNTKVVVCPLHENCLPPQTVNVLSTESHSLFLQKEVIVSLTTGSCCFFNYWK